MKPDWLPSLRVPVLPPMRLGERCVLAIGTGFGSGFIRPFSASWGSLVGFAYAFALLQVGNLPAMLTIGLLVLALSIPVAGKCAQLIGEHDPKCVVIDEIACAPLAVWPALFCPMSPLLWLLAFVVYRVADLVKPFPARRLEKLPGGWGIVLDDVASSLWMSGLWSLGLFALRRG